MGNGNSILVRTNRQSFTQGDVIEGFVALDCRKKFHSDGLVVQIIGDEGVRFSGTSQAHFKRRLRFLTFEVPIVEMQSAVNVGQYSFPFRFRLPENLHSSFVYKNVDIKIAVIYSIKAILKVRNGSLTRSELVNEQPLRIIGRDEAAAPVTPIQEVRHLRAIGLIPCGTCSILASPQQGAYRPGDKAIIFLDIVNRSKLGCSNITVKLMRTFKGHLAHSMKNEQCVQVLTLPGFPAQFSQQARMVEIMIPSDLTPTIRGGLIQCEYRFKIAARGLGVAGPVRIELPTCIRPVPLPGQADPTSLPDMPPAFDWSPQVYPVTASDVPLPEYSAVPSAPLMFDDASSHSGSTDWNSGIPSPASPMPSSGAGWSRNASLMGGPSGTSSNSSNSVSNSSSSSSAHPHGVTGYVKEVGSHIAESFREAGHKLAEGFRGHKADDDAPATSSWASSTAPYTAAGSSAGVLGPSHGSLLRDDENMITNDEAQHQQPPRAADNVVTDSASTATSFLPSLFSSSSSSSSNSNSSSSTHMPDMNITTRSNYERSHTGDSSRGKSVNDTTTSSGQSSGNDTSSDTNRFSPNVHAPTEPAPVDHLFREPDRTEADRDNGNWASKWVGGKDSGSSSSSGSGSSADKTSSRVPGSNDLDPRIVEDVSRTE
eukprot:m.130509 g.130509  ORF g.130509 m.130509 type:complete len:654 (-) comp16436_c1_seq4:277-2238(-)